MIARGQLYLQTDLGSRDFACDVTRRHFVKTRCSSYLHNASLFLIDIDKMDR